MRFPLSPRLARLTRVSLLAIALSAGPVLAACGPRGAHPVVPSERKSPATPEVSDDGFAGAVHDLLVSEPGSHERKVRLAGVESRQMARALAKFKARTPERGLAAVTGGMYMMRAGELSPAVLGPAGPEALKNAVRELSLKGDEGKARGLYEILARVAPDGERADIRAHLDAIASWTKDAVASGGPVQSAGGLERVTVRRRLLEPSDVALEEAVAASIDWFKKANALRIATKATHQAPPRDEGIEAYRALQTGPAVIVSLYLRDADAVAALSALDKAEGREMLYPELARALEAVADGPDALRWVEVLHAMRPLVRRDAPREEDDFGDDRDLFRAAAFGVAAAAYRMDPTHPELALTVASALQEYGMAEATPAIVYEAARAHSDPRTMSAFLTATIYAMSSEMQGGDVDAARRTFRAAHPLLQVADEHANAKLNPSPSRVRAMMGDIELGEGRIDEARALLTASASVEKSGAVLLTLAKIDWRDKKPKAALDRLREGLSAADASRDHGLRGELLLLTSDIMREQGDAAGARTALGDALKDLTAARGSADAEDRAKVERVLSRVLDRFGETQPAQRALDRAFEAAPRDKDQAALTVGQMVGRAFVRADIAAARDGLKRGIAADLDNEDLVYYALWVRLLEKQLHMPSDGAPDRVFTTVSDDGRWIAKLSLFGNGKLKAEDLVGAAKTPAQKTEALFYEAMDKRAAGDAKSADDFLRQVVAGPGVQLQEVTMARDILSGSKAQLGGPLPSGVAIP